MEKLFSTLCGKKLYSNEWAETLDWIFDEDKFSEEKGWKDSKSGKNTSNNKNSRYTNKIKKLDYISLNKNYFTCLQKDLKNKLPKTEEEIYLVFTKNGAICQNLIRHIRNGIAHGKTRIYTNSTKKYKNVGNLFIEIKDFGKKDKETGETQTAYINIPLEYIVKLHNLYIETEKESSNSSKAKSSKKRSTAKKQTKQPIKV